MESITVATARAREHRRTTTSIGTVLALRSVALRNELAGTVAQANLSPGEIVDAGTVLVALDVSVEEAELAAQEAQATLADAQMRRMERANQSRGASEMDVDRARAERDVAKAQLTRTRAVIEKKTIRAPFRARIGMSDLHPGQYLKEGTELTTLQGVDESVHVDFSVAQDVAATLRQGDTVRVFAPGASTPMDAKVVAVDARVDPSTRNSMVRAQIDGVRDLPSPGASVRVLVPVGPPFTAVAVPVNALRKGPGGDQVYVIAADDQGKQRAHARRVRSGAVLGDEVLIVEGLTPGEQVAASGSFKLRESVLVAFAESPADASANASR
jgi:membrane fusion protein (multidrug efflux system)